MGDMIDKMLVQGMCCCRVGVFVEVFVGVFVEEGTGEG